MQLAVFVLLFVLLLIVVRKIGSVRIPMWVSMTAGAAAVLLLGQISVTEAYAAVSWDVILFLFGMFIVGAAVDLSGFLKYYAHRCFHRLPTARSFLLVFIFAAGFLSAVLMNDTIAIVFAPFSIWCAGKYAVSPKIFLFALAAAVTTGGLLSPIGAPQNLLIAAAAFRGSFLPFFIYLAVPAVLSLLVLYFYLSRTLPKSGFGNPAPARSSDSEDSVRPVSKISSASVSDISAGDSLFKLTKISIALVLAGVSAGIVLSAAGYSFPPVLVAFFGVLPLILFSGRRLELLKAIDWPTLLFFISMFILIESVHMTGFFQTYIPESFGTSVPVLYSTSLILSQFISNVPYVSLALPLLENISAAPIFYITLLAGSTLAGNLTIFGAASNVIIIQNAEKFGETLTFFEFLKLGLPLILIQSAVFVGWLILVSFFGAPA
ncbi:MAG: anion transporter [Methanosarcinales archaeon]|jgi:Na+/H+ antiporter NhaD/arsenite permease-like protein|nr:anion transporter [Methanosarcinales archaeon]